MAVDPEHRPLLAKPSIQLVGSVDEAMYDEFRGQLRETRDEGPISLAITTTGGDPEIARAMADDLRLLSEHDDRMILFVGKVAVYSAGAVLMAGFPVNYRYLTNGTRIMIHERQITKTLELSDPLRGAEDKVCQLLTQIRQSIKIEEEGFRMIVKDSKVDFETIRERAASSWYIDAQEAKELGLIADVV